MNALIIFIKNPQLGKVKTRLAKTLGDAQALEIYHQLSDITRKNAVKLAKTGITSYLYYSDYVDSTDAWSSDIFIKKTQNGVDLGARMANAFSDVLAVHNKACIIGSDCPTLSVSILKKAFTNLEKQDAVVGPSTDGGYYLLGLSRDKTVKMRKNTEGASQSPITNHQSIFTNMEWSVDTVLSETIKRLKEQQQSYVLLPALTDIDEEKDWVAYIAKKNL
jgi:uncharacterized protein